MKTWRFDIGDVGNLGFPTVDAFSPGDDQASIFGRVVLGRRQVDPDVADAGLGRCLNGRIIESGERVAVAAVGTHARMIDALEQMFASIGVFDNRFGTRAGALEDPRRVQPSGLALLFCWLTSAGGPKV